MKPHEHQPIANTIMGWHDLIQNPTEVHIPRELDKPLPVLKVHTNGMQCRRDPDQCFFIATHINSMRRHWQQVHGWTQQNRRGCTLPNKLPGKLNYNGHTARSPGSRCSPRGRTRIWCASDL
ncbi:hypothetical protein BDW75DRAFT_224457 [Aspergillus navahoensis]